MTGWVIAATLTTPAGTRAALAITRRRRGRGHLCRGNE